MSRARRKPLRRGGRRPAAGQPERPLAERILASLPLLLLALVLTFLVERTGALRQAETAALDLQAKLALPGGDPARHGGDEGPGIVAVLIKDQDHEALFGGKSPLDPMALQRLVQALAAAGPRVIAVNLDTSAPGFRALEPPAGVPVIWAREATFLHRRDRFKAKASLGGRSWPGARSGLAVIELDADRRVRRYQHAYRTTEGTVPSLIRMIVCEARVEGRRCDAARADPEEQLFIRYTPGTPYPVVSASDVPAMAAAPEGILRDKIIILGADYAAQDEHETPVGWRLGSDILAQAVRTELEGEPARPVDWPALVVLQLAGGVLFLLLFHLFPFRRGLLVGLCAIPVLAGLASLAAFHTFSRWGSFAPVLGLLLGQQVWEKVKKYRSGLTADAAGILRPDGAPEEPQGKRPGG
jgi:CHASE2 domain-containing sensor protein